MKKYLEIADDLNWYMLSADQGQTVELWYAYDFSGGAYKRIFDRSDRTTDLYYGELDWDLEEEGDDWESPPQVIKWTEVTND